MVQRLLTYEDLHNLQGPDEIASLFQKLGYSACSQTLDINDLELSSNNAEAIKKAYLIASQENSNLQVLLFQLHSTYWLTNTATLERITGIAKNLCDRPTFFLILVTINYKQLMLVSISKKFDRQMQLTFGIRKVKINLIEPNFSEVSSYCFYFSPAKKIFIQKFIVAAFSIILS
jgi:RNA polymerase primary sigma factor